MNELPWHLVDTLRPKWIFHGGFSFQQYETKAERNYYNTGLSKVGNGITLLWRCQWAAQCTLGTFVCTLSWGQEHWAVLHKGTFIYCIALFIMCCYFFTLNPTSNQDLYTPRHTPAAVLPLWCQCFYCEMCDHPRKLFVVSNCYEECQGKAGNVCARLF